MDYKEHIRKKDGGLQAILSYKEGRKWKQKSKQGFENSKKGEKKAQQWMHQIINQLENDLHLNKDYQDITFKEYIDMYTNDRKINLSDSTVDTFEAAFKKFDDLDNMKLKEIKTIDIQRCVNKLSKVYRRSTIETYIKKLKTAFNYAINVYEIINISPIKKLEYSGQKSVNKIALNRNETNNLLEKLKRKDNKQHYLMSLLAVKCGLRVGEICGLTWDKIDFKNCIIDVNIQWNKVNGGYGFTKLKSNNSYRQVPFNSLVKKELLQYKEKTVINIDNRLFNIKNTNITASYLGRIYKRLGYDISIHELRHTYATNLVQAGLDFKTVASLLGHDIKETMNTYSHVNDDMIQRAIEIINVL